MRQPEWMFPLRVMLPAAVLLLGLPLLGVFLIGGDLAAYMEFPPQTRRIDHAPFAWPAFIALAVLLLVTVLPPVVCAARAKPADHDRLAVGARPFPLWGWLGLGGVVLAWIVAWNRFAWLAPFQPFTFTPLWLGYIVVVNALTWRRSGHCMLKDRPRYMLALALLSAAFWWFFEYLNRFVQNWYYVGIGNLSAGQYILFATLPFATVLPAVMGTYELLATYPQFSAGLRNAYPVHVRRPRLAATVWLVSASAGLAGIGIWPDILFPLLWLAPLIILTSLQAIRGESTRFAGLARGDWRDLCLLACAALICGIFWELWNYHSLAKWIYSVPYVGRFRVFEMPVLGYAGYLPFGLECAVVADLLVHPDTRFTFLCKETNT